MQERQHDAANQITAIDNGWIVPEYDDAGNMISGPKPGDGTTELKFVYDAWNRLVKVTDSSDVAIAEYRYDGQGRRIQRTVGETTDDYYYNEGGQVLEVRRGGEENPLEQYVWDIRYVGAPVVRFYDGDTDGNYLDASGNVLYYVQDANWNVTALVDAASGAVVERYVYDAYGKVSIFTGARDDQGNSTTEWQPRSVSLFDNQILYSGYRRDPATGLYHTDTREYDAYLGRWLGRDSGGYIDGMNLYQYVSGNPATLVDPSGLCGGTAFDPWNTYGAAGPIGESGVAGPAGAVSPSYADMMTGDAPSRSGTALDLWGYDGVWPFDSVYAGDPGDYSDLDVPYEEWDPDAVDLGLAGPMDLGLGAPIDLRSCDMNASLDFSDLPSKYLTFGLGLSGKAYCFGGSQIEVGLRLAIRDTGEAALGPYFEAGGGVGGPAFASGTIKGSIGFGENLVDMKLLSEPYKFAEVGGEVGEVFPVVGGNWAAIVPIDKAGPRETVCSVEVGVGALGPVPGGGHIAGGGGMQKMYSLTDVIKTAVLGGGPYHILTVH